MLINRVFIHRAIFFIALMFFLVGIPFCRPFMSVGGIILVANWFLEGRFIEKWNQIKNNRLLFICLLIFFVYVVGLLYTENYHQAGKSIWLKIPLFFIPIIFATTKPLSTNEFHNLLKVYLIGILISTIYGFVYYQQNHFIDRREMAVFISYIRFEMNLCFAVFVSFYLILNEKYKWQKTLLCLPLLWVLFLICYMGALTALLLLVFVVFALVLKKAIERKELIYQVFYPLLFFLFITAASIYTYSLIKSYYAVDFNSAEADVFTADSNRYVHDTSRALIENGSYIFTYVCEKELREAWNAVSTLSYDGMDMRNEHKIRHTLIRYLNSKGLRKDRGGVEALTADDIKNIENGIANVVYAGRQGFTARLYGLLWELDDYKTNRIISGYTLPQRIELWKNALLLIKQQPIIGVGTGDIKDAYACQLLMADSPLKNTNKLCHNQFLLFLIGFGFFGFLLIMFSLIYPVLWNKRFKNDLFFVFLLIVFFSMMTDDTLERQDGLTFFAFFYALFLFLFPSKNEEKEY